MPREDAAPRAANGRYTRTVEQAEQDAEAARLRSRGRSYPQIAAELGISKQSAQRAVARVLAETVAEAAAEVRQLELDRLDFILQQAIGVLEREHLVVSHGEVVRVNRKPLIDDAPVLQAIDRILAIQTRRAKLLGLDAPKQVEVITVDTIDAEIRRLEQELAEQDRAAVKLGGGDAGETSAVEGAARAEG